MNVFVYVHAHTTEEISFRETRLMRKAKSLSSVKPQQVCRIDFYYWNDRLQEPPIFILEPPIHIMPSNWKSTIFC